MYARKGEGMKGNRREDIYQDSEGWCKQQENLALGDYYKLVYQDGHITWFANTPTGWLGGLDNHEVVENEDGTITVSPSILVAAAGEKSWHGYLRQGEWSEV